MRPWVEARFHRWWPIVTAPWFLFCLAVVVCVYIWALIWTRGPAAHDPGIEAVSLSQPDTPEQRHWMIDEILKKKRLDMEAKWEVERREKFAPHKPQRDAFLKEGLAYAASGEWGQKGFMDYAGQYQQMGEATDRFHQLAADGVISVWGKRTTRATSLFELIPPEHWHTHHLWWPDILTEDATTKPLDGNDHTNSFSHIMISKREFEREWPHAG